MAGNTVDQGDLKIVEKWIEDDYYKLIEEAKKIDVQKWKKILEQDIQAYLYESLGKDEFDETIRKYNEGGLKKDEIEESIFEKIMNKKCSIISLLVDILGFDGIDLGYFFEMIGVNAEKTSNNVLPRNEGESKKKQTNKEKGEPINKITRKLLLLFNALDSKAIKRKDLFVRYSNEIEGYISIYVPHINKTIFISMLIGNATYICDGNISIEQAQGGKIALMELGAIKINYNHSEPDKFDESWKEKILKVLFPITPEFAKEQVRQILEGKKDKRFGLDTGHRKSFNLGEKITVDGFGKVFGYRSIAELFLGKDVRKDRRTNENFLELSRAIFGENDEKVKKLEEKVRAKQESRLRNKQKKCGVN